MGGKRSGFAGGSSSETNELVLYCTMEGEVVGGRYVGGVYRSTDGGRTWKQAMGAGIDISPGSSGGGVFWNGYHIGNNWSNSQQNDISNGKLLRAYSTVALNSQPTATASPPL